MAKALKRRFAHFLEQLRGNGLGARLIRGGMGSAGIQALNRLLALALGVLLARNLGAEGYGVYAYAFAIMSVLMVIAEAGVPNLLLREVAASNGLGDWGLLRGMLNRAGMFLVLTGCSVALIGMLILWAVGGRMSPAEFHLMALMLLVLPLAAGIKAIAHALQGLHQVTLGQSVGTVFQPALVLMFVGLMFMFWPVTKQPQFAMSAQLAAAVLVVLSGWCILQRMVPEPAKSARPIYRSREWLSKALPFTLIGAAGLINNQTDLIMLGWFSSSKEVGVYRVAMQGATLVAFSLQVANNVLAPQFARLYARRDLTQLQQLATRSARVVLMMAIPVAFVFILFGGTLASWVFGAEFVDAHLPLSILAAGHLVSASFGSLAFLLNMTGHERIAARILWQTAFLNIILNVLLIPFFGVAGAAMATLISMVLWNLLLWRQARRRLGVSFQPFLLTSV